MKISQNTTVSATIKLFRLGVILLLALMLITACGKDGNTDEPEATPTAATESTGTPTPTAATPSPTAEPTNEPTTEPTATPTAEPTATPIADPNAVLNAAVNAFSEENAALLDTHKAQYRNELRDACKEAPVQKFGLLTTVSLGGDLTVELYETAGFGYTSAWKGSEANPEHAGVDKTKEMYTYGVVGRLFENGKLIADTGTDSFSREWETNQIRTTVSWIPADDAFTNAVCKMVGLTPASSDCLLRTVTTETWVDSSLAIHADACYIGDSTTPAFTGRKFTIMGNDGGFFGEHIYLADGSELPDFSELTTIANGEGFLSREVAEWPFDGRKVSWTLAKTASGVQIVGLRTDDFDDSNGSYAVAFYIYIDGCLFEYSGEFVL